MQRNAFDLVTFFASIMFGIMSLILKREMFTFFLSMMFKAMPQMRHNTAHDRRNRNVKCQLLIFFVFVLLKKDKFRVKYINVQWNWINILKLYFFLNHFFIYTCIREIFYLPIILYLFEYMCKKICFREEVTYLP